MITRYKAADPSDPTSKAEYKVLAAGAQRYWHGTRAAFEQVKNDIPNNTMICITDDNGAPSYYARNPVWGEAVAVTTAQLKAGYSCPSDGIIVGTFAPNAYHYNEEPTILINNITIAKCRSTAEEVAPGSIQCQVNKNDIVKIGPDASAQAHTGTSIYFVPFEDSVTDPMIVTRDYIRNQNILSDYEAVTFPFTAQYDGELVATATVNNSTILSINGTVIGTAVYSRGIDTVSNSVSIAFKKSDVITAQGAYSSAFARYYKLRDYTGR